MATFSDHVRARSDAELVALLLRRPDLATPSPSTLSSLAARATSRASLERALAGVDALVLQVVESVVALHDGTTPVRVEDVVRALGVEPSDAESTALVERAVADATALLLLRPDEIGPDAAGMDLARPGVSVPKARRGAVPAPAPSAVPALVPAPGLLEVLGPYPAGLAPAAVSTPSGIGADELATALADAPPRAQQVLDALTWAPPVGLLPAPHTPAREAVQWLLARGLLVPGDARHVLLPRDVSLALRGGRTHSALRHPPEVPTGPRHRPELVAGESAMAAERAVRLVAGLVRVWEIEPAPVLRSGGLGVRELRRLAQTLEIDETEAAFVVELAGAAGLVADDAQESPVFAPTLAVDDWLAAELADRWALLARTWLTTTRTPWMVGARDERGTVRAALDPELSRPWAPRLRLSVLGVFADTEPGLALTPEQVVEQLTWRTPRSVPPAAATAATLREAELLGVVAAGALSPAGRALLPVRADGADPGADPGAGTDPAQALRAGLSEAVDEILLQGDLTGVVPGRPAPGLESLIERAARVESRGGALTVRFTPETVRAALDAGTTADELLADLAAYARGGVPQPLEYLVRDSARRHGRLRAGAASSYVRAEDPALLAGLVADPRLAPLRLVQLAPTVLAAQATTRELLAALREHGLAPVAEGSDGQIVHAERVIRRVPGRSRRTPAVVPDHASAAAALTARLELLVPELRRAEDDHDVDQSVQWSGGRLRPERDRPGRAPFEPTGSGRATTGSTTRSTTSRSTAGAGDLDPNGTVPGAGSATVRSRAEQVRTAGRGTADPVTALGMLREAVADRTDVWIELVDQRGNPQRRRVRPLHLDGGRLRALDPARDSELTVAVHRIASVTRIEPEPEPADPSAHEH